MEELELLVDMPSLLRDLLPEFITFSGDSDCRVFLSGDLEGYWSLGLNVLFDKYLAE